MDRSSVVGQYVGKDVTFVTGCFVDDCLGVYETDGEYWREFWEMSAVVSVQGL